MSNERFGEICDALHIFGAQLSAPALRIIQQRRYITELQQTQEQLSESEERYRALVQRSSEAILLINPDTRKVIETNQHFQQMLGFSEEELKGMSVYEIVVVTKENVDRYYDEILPVHYELPVECRLFRHKNGHLVEVVRSGAMVHLKGKNVYMVTARDVTERKLIEEKMNFLSFHDILTELYNRTYFEEEMMEMKRHSEIGHRIANSSPDLLPVADWVLKHQEWWNGDGYPLGLVGENIPIECRIFAIADAYDAMTSDRPYRKAMSHDAALAELRRCAGAQFDPTLVELFIQGC